MPMPNPNVPEAGKEFQEFASALRERQAHLERYLDRWLVEHRNLVDSVVNSVGATASQKSGPSWALGDPTNTGCMGARVVLANQAGNDSKSTIDGGNRFGSPLEHQAALSWVSSEGSMPPLKFTESRAGSKLVESRQGSKMIIDTPVAEYMSQEDDKDAGKFASEATEANAGGDMEDAGRGSFLKVRVVGAKGLRNTDWFGKSDPFCAVEIQGKPDKNCKTMVVNDSLAPRWNQTFEFDNYEQGDTVVFTILDKDTARDGLLGKAVLGSQKFFGKKGGFRGELMLTDAGKGAEAYVQVEVEFVEKLERVTRRKTQRLTASSTSAWRASEDEYQAKAQTTTGMGSEGCAQIEEDTGRCNGLRAFMESPVFENTIAVLIIMNAVSVGVETEYMARNGLMEAPQTFIIAQYVVTAAFFTECVMRWICRFLASGATGDSSWLWFDTVVVAAALVEHVLQNLSTIGRHPILVLARMARIVRIVRIIGAVSWLTELKKMCTAVMSTFRALTWSLVLMLIILYITSVCITEGASQHLLNQDEVSPEDLVIDEDFGTVARSLYTLLLSFTGGVSWGEPCGHLFQLGWMYVGIFLLFILFTLFAFLNIITGFFCENAIEVASRDKEYVIRQQLEDKKKYMSEFKDLFSGMDLDGSGEISLTELQDHINDRTMQAYFAHLELPMDNAWDIFRLLDSDLSGTVSIEEFVVGCLRLRGPAKAVNLAALDMDLKRQTHLLLKFMEYTEGCLQHLLGDTNVPLPASPSHGGLGGLS